MEARKGEKIHLIYGPKLRGPAEKYGRYPLFLTRRSFVRVRILSIIALNQIPQIKIAENKMNKEV